MLALLLLLAGGLSSLSAQTQEKKTYYTLTNGRLWWSNGLENQPDIDWMDPVAFDASRQDAYGNWEEVHPHGTSHVTHITQKGNWYLKLDLTNPALPQIKAQNSFDLYCVWLRTGSTGYYYQEWTDPNDSKTYRYYLIGTETGLTVTRSEVGKPLEQSTYWYDWDYGAAVWEKPVIDGVKKNRYYWIMFQDMDRNCGTLTNPRWTMSRHSYQRPEDIYYLSYDPNDTNAVYTNPDSAEYAGHNSNRLRYYDDLLCGYHMPAGNGALFMPVIVTIHDKEILHVDNDDQGTPYGLQRTEDASHHTLGTGITVTDNNGDPVTELTYDVNSTASVNLAAQMNYYVDASDGNRNKVPMSVMPSYTEYKEETYRRGIHLNFNMRTSDVFGSAGVPTYTTHNYWGNDGVDHLSSTPSEDHDYATDTSVTFSIDNRSRRYLTLQAVPGERLQCKLNFTAPVMEEHTAEIYVTVRYDNGVVQRDTVQLKLKFHKPTVTPQPVNGPVVRGSVFGGGRMANVGGNTVVYVHGADSINHLYGGNDIAGWVQGDEGATLKIGTEFTNKDHPVHIGSVYGGGNGYYTYQGINAGYNETTSEFVNPYYSSQSTALIYQSYYFNGKVYPWNSLPSGYMASAAEADRINKDQSEWSGLTPVVDHEFAYIPFWIGQPDNVDQQEKGDDGDGTIPYIKTAHITVGVPEGKDGSGNPIFFVTADNTPEDKDSTHWHNDYILIDTLFGGARNAFIGVTANEGESPENGVSIDINGGTIFSVFGGNNVGGSVANTSTVFVNVHDTKLISPSSPVVEDSWLSGFGRDYGIRYLFGGGNLVEGSHANVKILGGMLDTVYLGGNKASVKNPTGLVECLRHSSNTTGRYGYNGHFICTNPTYPTNLNFSGGIGTQGPLEALASNEHFFDGYGPGNFEPEKGHYNIRCLFGGNNAADMDNQTAIVLHSGGISSVYGGGNVGDMNNDQLYDVTDNTVAPNLPGGSTTVFHNELFPDPQYNYYIQEAFDVDYLTRDMRPEGWAEVYGRATMPNKVGAIVTALPTSKIVCDYVFGGSRMGNVKNSCGVYLAGGVFGYVNGGNDVSGDIGSETGGGTYLVLNNNVLVVGDAIAGSDGYYHCDDGSGYYDNGELYDTYADGGESVSYDPYNDYVGMLLPTHNSVNLYLRGGLVLGQVLGGGVHADVGFKNGTTPKIKTYNPATKTREERTLNLPSMAGSFNGLQTGSIHFMASHGRVLSNVFGGGFQSSVNGLAYLTLRGDVQIDGSFFSGNDCTGNIQSFSAYLNPNDLPGTVNGYPANSYTHADSVVAFQAMVASDPTIALNGDNGDGTWGAAYSAYLRIKDTPQITCVYGSGNGAYDYDGTRPEYESISFCSDGSGTLTPKQSSTFIDINTSGGHIDTVFGGGNGVGVEEAVVVFLNNTDRTVHTVGTIFGGNNQDNMMDVVPDIWLQQGIVNTVFGGSNNGIMGAGPKGGPGTIVTDVNGNELRNISTHVVLESENVTVLDTVFGGNRMSDVVGNTYVEVRQTTSEGVRYVFAGNDISGHITGAARVDVSGGTVKNLFGGSNGYYDYVEIGDSLYRIYPYGKVQANDTTWTEVINEGTPQEKTVTHSRCIAIAARPDVDSTRVNLWGGDIGAGVDGLYGGGSMADCRTTSVIVNDTIAGNDRELNIYGTLYGGGMGNYLDLNARSLQGNRLGNVTDNTHIDLYHADLVSYAKAYGGGRGGDVMNTYITIHNDWNTPFDELYGGCWGSDVFGTTHLNFHGVYLVQNLFGGNDFAGDVYRTEINIHSGRFYNIYGAGNGDYPESDYTTGVYADANKHIRRPNTEYVTLNFNSGTVEGNLYGGGKLGSIWTYKKDPATHVYLLDNNGKKIPDYTQRLNPEDYSYVITNIHGGLFQNNVYGGACGRGEHYTSTEALIYGLKVLNMDGGEIRMSLYGGSESVNDGYASECTSTNTTTKRPSSIINMTGGTVESNLYGAGYLGTTHGSVYVNIGTDAIDSCVAYSTKYVYNSADSLYMKFKPGAVGSLSPDLAENTLVLNHSIYAGANWGAGTGQASFNTAGFVGGESMIRVDGKGYNTSSNELSPLPQMNIGKSLFGSGTSVKGGDVRSHIDLWNYGILENCQSSKELESVQRADRFFSHNTSVHYLGATDGTSAYISEPYTMLRLGEMSFRGYNVAEYDASLNYVASVNFYEEDLNATTHALELVPVQALRNVQPTGNACGNSATVCGTTSVVSPSAPTSPNPEKRHTLLIFNNGIDVSIQNESNVTGPVAGFGYVSTPWGYSSSIVGKPTIHREGGNTVSSLDQPTTASSGTWLDGYAGFASPCDTTNRYTANRGAVSSITWLDSEDEGWSAVNAEYPYTNFVDNTDSYREWKVGTGIRLRETALLAHSEPTKLAEDVNIVVDLNGSGYYGSGTKTNNELALAKASITLPATQGGHYYKLNTQGIVISGSNSMVNLVDEAWHTNADFTTLAQAYGTPNSIHTNVSNLGSWKSAEMEVGGIPLGAEQIVNHPDNTFGLVMVPGSNFKTDGSGAYVMPTIYTAPGSNTPAPSADQPTTDMADLILSGNAYYNAAANYCSPQVATGDRIMPTMDFLLTYNPQFASTFLGTIEFTLDEYDAAGNYVGPVKVKTYLSTIIENFRNMETSVMAMFNNGNSDEFTRRVILPITLDENRELFITSVQWEPTDGDGVTQNNAKFRLTEDAAAIKQAAPTVNNLFNIHVYPNDAITSELNENLGWTSIDQPDLNVFTLARPAGSDPNMYAADGNATVSLINHLTRPDGMRVGILDGRGTAAFNVTLNYDGERNYPENGGRGYLGKVVLGMKWKKGEHSGTFNFTIYVRTRDHGDTIYLASADQVSRNGYTVKPYWVSTSYYNELMGSNNTDSVAKAPTVIGKSPNCYVQSFQHALSSNVYQEGDVIAIIDQVNINERPVHVQGSDGPPIQVIRYDGHHHELPSDTGGVYRGPMIVVSGPGVLTAQNIDFHGGAGARVKRVLRDNSGNPILDANGNLRFATSFTYDNHTYTKPQDARDMKMPDTNEVFAPIIVVKYDPVSGQAGSVTLSDGTKVRHNWNEYGSEASQRDANGLPLNPEMMGAISVTGGGTLTLKGDVSIRDNFGHTFNGDNSANGSYNPLRPYNGAIYVDGGHVVLPASNKLTAIDITRNRLMDPAIHSSGSQWWNLSLIEGMPSRFTLDTTHVYSNWEKANVFLTRTNPTSGDPDLKDGQTDVIQVTGVLGTNTRIGVRKWFPGPTTRDTIRFAVNAGADFNILSKVYENRNFQSDDDFFVFFSPDVNSLTEYLLRCATFRHQRADLALPIADNSTPILGKDVLYYGILPTNTCPTGNDTIIYRVQGGFAPYNYTWEVQNGASYDLAREYTTPYSNIVVSNAVEDNDNTYYLASVVDTLVTPSIDMPRSESERFVRVRVTADDATGYCPLSKDIEITIHKVRNLGAHEKWEPVTSPNGWTDTVSRVTANRVPAVGDRYYKSVVVTPYVSYDASMGNISASFPGDDNDMVYQYIDADNRNDLANLLFCEGDVIQLMTLPNIGDAEFLMWNFDPFNNNPATYVVPGHDDDVIAYYSARYYWTDVVNTPVIGGAVNAEVYDYTLDNSPLQNVESGNEYTYYNGATEVPNYNKAGYVTTYSGDVHIYNENGLAWFVSVVNGLNGYQSRPFQFNTVYLHKKADGSDYDMQRFLWTPVGTRQYGFRGRLYGVSADVHDITPITDPDERVVIKNIMLNEPNMSYVGFFGTLQGAECVGITLRDIFVRGGQYVGGLVAQADNTAITNCAVDGSGANSSILTTNYVSGGLVGNASNSEITDIKVKARFTGNAVYSGGVAGVGESGSYTNIQVQMESYASGLYVGGGVGSETGEQTDEPSCFVDNLRATVTPIETSDNGDAFNVHLIWQATTGATVQVGYCEGSDWYEAGDGTTTNNSWQTVTSGSSYDFTITPSATTNSNIYTVAVRVRCDETADWNMLTTNVTLTNSDTPEACPVYTLTAEVNEQTRTVKALWSYNGGNVTANTSVRVGYCAGTVWNSAAATSTYSATQGYVEFTIPTTVAMDSVYTVALYSPCDQQWYTYTIANCPLYRLQTAAYGEPTPTEQHHTVSMYWYNTTPNTMYNGSNVKVAIYPGTTAPSNLSWTEITPSCNNDGVCSHTFTIDDLMTANPACTTYTVALMSICSGTVYSTQVSVPLPETSCPEYEISATYANGSVIMSWTTTGQTGNGENVMLGICAGSTWQGTFSVEAYPSLGTTPDNSQGNTYTFSNLPTLAEGQTTYTVALRSNCNADAPAQYTATVNTVDVTGCPQYQITDAFYDEQASVGGDPNSTIPYITVKWRNTNNTSEQNVEIGICPGATWNETRAVSTMVSATNNIVSTSGECSYSYDVTNLTLTANDNNTYTVMLISQTCTTSVVSRTVTVNGGTTHGIFGPEGDMASLERNLVRKSLNGGRSVIANNYFHVTTNGRTQRIGGIAGRASNTDIMNNYVYGTVGTGQNSGSVAAVIGNGTQAKGNYAAHGTGNKNVGQQQGGMVSNTAGFEGQGNNVVLDRTINGVENLTLALNRWVRQQNEQGGHYRTWRNDLDGDVNNGYPFFGQPDMTSITANLLVEGCDWAVFQGIVYTHDTVIVSHTIDYDEMIDSNVTTTIRLHGTTHTLVADSVMTGVDYVGYGFTLSADELRILALTIGDEGRASIIISDTLTSSFGCDSIVVLTLTFYSMQNDIPEVEETPTTVNVYPNPTTGVVYVECDDMSHVEVYDNEGRRLQNYDAYGQSKVTVDMSRYVSGVYFVRVHSPQGITIQKVIKER